MMDAIKSIKGVGSVREFGSDYAMRIWLDPAKMQNLGVTIFWSKPQLLRDKTYRLQQVQLVKILLMGNKHFNTLSKLKVVLWHLNNFGNIAIKKL